MTNNPSQNRLTRSLSLGLSLALIGGASLVTAAPAAATVRLAMHVNASDIAAAGTASEGWHRGDTDAPDSFADVPGGIQISGGSEMIYAFAEPLRLPDFTGGVEDDSISWTTTTDSGPAFYQVPVIFGASGSTTLSPVAPRAGTNRVNLADTWTTSSSIGNTPAGAELPLADLLELLRVAAGSEAAPQVTGFGLRTNADTTSVVTKIDWVHSWWTLGAPAPELPALPAGSVTVTGKPVLDQVLTASLGGWPDGTVFSYKWLLNGDEFIWEPIEKRNAPTTTVNRKFVTYQVSVMVTGELAGYTPTTVTSALTAAVTAPQLPAAAAPVADSSGLPSFFMATGDLRPQTDLGLPAGPVDPATAQTATFEWGTGDSFVDVFAYSAPTLLGTVPAGADGVTITLTPATLASLGAGTHTVVAVGQTSYGVRSFELVIGPAAAPAAADPIAKTGADAGPLVAGAALLTMLGAALLVARRRQTARDAR
ncbi:hypothetical protein [Microterricola viridarii]|uniref:LPXTG-motif cell wall anchor domain-containing protein n=1 Tax=Microterricola viridarii TaxID=412690 RepID=A0A0Y0QD10_9MICO|nr:hypothetical protein [Microterricola viridarii]AMB60066.1 hypothetical protein AWU67_15710 [Microterricola viridarii]